MRTIIWLSLIFINWGVLLSCRPQPAPPSFPSSSVPPPEEKDLRYHTSALKHSVVHTLLIPASSRFSVTPAVSQRLSTLENFARTHYAIAPTGEHEAIAQRAGPKAIAAINGGFFDPENQKSTSYVVRQGVLVADPRQNERLMNNPKLAPYLKKIFNRTEFRRYRCNQTVRYDIALHSEPSPPGCQLLDALGGGPRLLPELTLVEEGFLDFANGKVIRDPLGNSQPKARSAIGITRDGSILVVMVAQKPEAPTTSGISLQALAAFMKAKGVEKAMNLDGGSSSSFYYKGKTVYGAVDKKGNWVKRELLSVLIIH